MSGSRSAEPVELPVACTLGPEDGPPRMRRWRAVADRGRLRLRRSGPRLEVFFEDGKGVREELEALADEERRCCSFVSWEVGTDGPHAVLRVSADPDSPDDVAPIAALFEAG